MAPTIPSVEPTIFRAGETVEWTKIVQDYPNTDGYALVYSFSGPSALASITATNVADGSYSVSIPATTTSALVAGRYLWAAHAQLAGAVYPVAQGTIFVEAKLLGTALTTHAERTLAVIEAALEGRLTSDMESYTIGTRQVTKIAAMELRNLRTQYKWEVWYERNPGKILTRKVAFVPA